MYLLDEVMKLENGKLTPRSYLISNQKIKYVNTSLSKWNERRLNVNGFILNSGNVMTDEQLLGLEFASFQMQQRQLIKRGCTTVAVFTQVHYERQILSKFKTAKNQMINSSIDYLIGLTVPPSLLKPTVIRTCQKLKIPVLNVQVKRLNELNEVPWTHIAQAMVTYPVVLLLETKDCSKKEKVAIRNSWFWYCKKYRIHTGDVPLHQTSWPKTLIQKTGLYPLKGELVVGSDTDYMLFLKKHNTNHNSQDLLVDERSHLDYDGSEPNIVVVRGRVLKVNEEYLLKPGFGNHVQVKKPGRFVPITEAYGYVETN